MLRPKERGHGVDIEPLSFYSSPFRCLSFLSLSSPIKPLQTVPVCLECPGQTSKELKGTTSNFWSSKLLFMVERKSEEGHFSCKWITFIYQIYIHWIWKSKLRQAATKSKRETKRETKREAKRETKREARLVQSWTWRVSGAQIKHACWPTASHGPEREAAGLLV